MRLLRGVLLVVATIASGSVDAANNARLEKHYDATLSRDVAFMKDLVAQIPGAPAVFASAPYVPFVAISRDGGVATATDAEGRRFVVARAVGANGTSTFTFARDGVTELQITYTPERRGDQMIGYSSSVRCLINPEYDFDISVRDTNLAEPASALKSYDFSLRIFGRDFHEPVWNAKKNLKFIPELFAVARTKPSMLLPLENYFTLALTLEGLVSDGLSVMTETASLASVQRPVRNAGMPIRSYGMDGTEGYWCGVGTLGANIVFLGGGSFVYAAMCYASATYDDRY